MRILQLGKFYPQIGGVDKVIFELSERISIKGIKCDVLCGSLDGNEKTIKINSFFYFICY